MEREQRHCQAEAGGQPSTLRESMTCDMQGLLHGHKMLRVRLVALLGRGFLQSLADMASMPRIWPQCLEQLAMPQLDTTYTDVTADLYCTASACTLSGLIAAGLVRRSWLARELLESLLKL